MLISGRFALVYEGLEVFEVEAMRFLKLIKVKVFRGIGNCAGYTLLRLQVVLQGPET